MASPPFTPSSSSTAAPSSSPTSTPPSESPSKLCAGSSDNGENSASTSKPGNSTIFRQSLLAMTCGYLCGGICAPLAVIRVRWQTDPTAMKDFRSILRFGHAIVKSEGLFTGLWKPGLFAHCMGIFVSASRTAFYPTIRDVVIRFSERDPQPTTASSLRLLRKYSTEAARGSNKNNSNKSANKNSNKQLYHMVVSGVISGALGYWFSTPVFGARNRLMSAAGNVNAQGFYTTGGYKGEVGPLYSSTLDCIRVMWREGVEMRANVCPLSKKSVTAQTGLSNTIGGFTNLWRGAIPLTLRGSVLTVGQLCSYDACKEHFVGDKFQLLNRDHPVHVAYRNATSMFRYEGPYLHFLASVVSAFGAATCAAPLDVIVIKYQIAKAVSGRKPSVLEVAMDTWRKDGPLGFYRGWTPAFANLAFGCCLYMPIYECLRKNFFDSYFR